MDSKARKRGPFQKVLIKSFYSHITQASLKENGCCLPVGLHSNLSRQCTQGIHFDGTNAKTPALEFVNRNGHINSRIYSLSRDGSLPTHVCTRIIKKENVKDEIYLDCAVSTGFPGSAEYNAGAQAYCSTRIHHSLKSKEEATKYLVSYVAFKEMRLSRSVVALNGKLKEAVKQALKAKTNRKKYHMLQKIFGEIGYYYPSRILLGVIKNYA